VDASIPVVAGAGAAVVADGVPVVAAPLSFWKSAYHDCSIPGSVAMAYSHIRVLEWNAAAFDWN
jgi:hypothetical protein